MSLHNKVWDPRVPFDPSKFPIFYGWVIVAASTIGMIASIPGQTMGVSVYTDTYIAALGLDRVQMTTAYLIGTGLSGFLVSTGGSMFDKLGARKFFVLAVMLFGSALVYMSQMDRLVQLFGMKDSAIFALFIASLGFTGIRFFGQGMVTLGSRSMLSKWWNLRRGRMVAISGCFVAFGFSLAPRFLDWEIQAFGWRGSLLVNAGVLMCGLSLIAWLFFRDNPEECGLEMDDGWHPDNRRENPDTLLLKEFTRSEAVRTYSFWIITLSLSFHGLFTTAYTFHVIDLARSFQVPRETILNFFIYSSFLSVAMNFLVGYITDRIRLRFVITLFCLGGFTFCGSLLMLPSTAGMVILVIGMGISWGVFPILSTVGYARYFGRAHIGAISGASMAWLVWGSAFGPLFFSLSKDYLGGYEMAIYASLLVYVLLAIGSLFSQNPSRQAQA
jgi:MFS family permease